MSPTRSWRRKTHLQVQPYGQYLAKEQEAHLILTMWYNALGENFPIALGLVLWGVHGVESHQDMDVGIGIDENNIGEAAIQDIAYGVDNFLLVTSEHVPS